MRTTADLSGSCPAALDMTRAHAGCVRVLSCDGVLGVRATAGITCVSPTWESLLLQLLLLSIWPLDWLPIQVADSRSPDPTALLVRPAHTEQQQHKKEDTAVSKGGPDSMEGLQHHLSFAIAKGAHQMPATGESTACTPVCALKVLSNIAGVPAAFAAAQVVFCQNAGCNCRPESQLRPHLQGLHGQVHPLSGCVGCCLPSCAQC